MPDLGSVQPFAILVAAAVGAMLGSLWYSPLLFRDAYLSALGRPVDNLGAPGAIAGSVLSCLVAACAVAFLVAASGASRALSGAVIGLILGLGVVAMTMLSDSLFSGWGWRLYLIQVGYRAVYLVLMGAICGGWPA